MLYATCDGAQNNTNLRDVCMPFAPSLPTHGQNPAVSALADRVSDLGAFAQLDGADLVLAFKAWLSGEGISQDHRQFRIKVGADNTALDGALHGRAMDVTEAINADVCVHQTDVLEHAD